MQKSKFDHSVFYRNSSSRIILLVVYVDDIVITEIEVMQSVENRRIFLEYPLIYSLGYS